MVKEEFGQNIKKNIDAQGWLDSWYPKEKEILERRKEDVTKLDVSGENLENSLRLENFLGLSKFECNNNKLSQLEVINCPNLEEIYCQNNQLVELNIQDCPNLKRIYCEQNKLIELNFSELKKLSILRCHANQLMKLNLTGCSGLEQLYCKNNQLTELELNSCAKLETLECYNNNLTTLKLSNLSQLKKIECYNNQLTELELNTLPSLTELCCQNNQLVGLDLANLNKLEKIDCSNNCLQNLVFPLSAWHLRTLDIKNNDLSERDLSIFRGFVNLQSLRIGNSDGEKIQKGVYNRFSGSLEALQKMNNLYEADISNTDISSILTYLPDSVYAFNCVANLRKDARCQTICDLLASEKGTFPQKIRSIKRKKINSQINQAIFLLEQQLIDNKIDSADLWKELKVNHKVNDELETWQDYLISSLSTDDLNVKNNNVLKIFKVLEEKAIAKEKQIQEELARQREELEKKIKDLETKTLTENEKVILQKMEELFSALVQFDDESPENTNKLAKMLEDYKKIDFAVDAPNLSEIFNSGGGGINLFHQIESFITKIEKKLSDSKKKSQTEITRLQMELKKVEESRQELEAELVKKDSEINASRVKREELLVEIDNLREKIQSDEKKLEQIPQKISNAEKEIKERLYDSSESTKALRQKKKLLEEEEKNLQKTVKKSKTNLEKLESEESRLQKMLDRAKDGVHKAEINIKIRNVQEQIEKLEQELASRPEIQNLVVQTETKNGF